MRYIGGEWGALYQRDKPLTMALSFPDMYELAMANFSIKVLYDLVARHPLWAPDRVFSPARDFEQLLIEENEPLRTLERGLPLVETDLVGFTLGYELGLTNVLTILDRGAIALASEDRSDNQPLVIAGGPGVTNPTAFGTLFDAVFLGESEAALPPILDGLAQLQNGSRREKVEFLASHQSIWIPGKTGVKRAIWKGFASEPGPDHYPIATMAISQEHGVVEIMRGCPQKCRFCHASVFYRPFRQRNPSLIFDEIKKLVAMGYRTITLSSLSSGDYPGIARFIRALAAHFGPKGISFQLPSLRIQSVGLDLFQSLSRGKKGGLTFAFESPSELGRTQLNKEVQRDKVLEILSQAEQRGWSLAKFYFMVGLPFSKLEDEVAQLEELLKELLKSTKMALNINIGTFVPKPHTPFQWARQVKSEDAFGALSQLKTRMRNPRLKIHFHNTFASHIEGILSRGGPWVQTLLTELYRRGARFDAWEEQLDRQLWLETSAPFCESIEELHQGLDLNEPTGWDDVLLGVTKDYLKKEWEKARKAQMTPQCTVGCSHRCGLCNDRGGIDVRSEEVLPLELEEALATSEATPELSSAHFSGNLVAALVIRYSRKAVASFYSQKTLQRIWQNFAIRAELPVSYTQGVKPRMRLEYMAPLSLGVEAWEELVVLPLSEEWRGDCGLLTTLLPGGMSIRNIALCPMKTKKDLRLDKLIEEQELQWEDGESLRLPYGHSLRSLDRKELPMSRTHKGNAWEQLLKGPGVEALCD